MGNDDSCCANLDEKKGEIQSKVNSLKYSSIIYNSQSSNRKPAFKTTKSVFSNPLVQPKDNIFDPEQSQSGHFSKINRIQKNEKPIQLQPSNHSHLVDSKTNKSFLKSNNLSQAFSASSQSKIIRQNFQNPEKGQSVRSNELHQETIQYLKNSNASQNQHRFSNHYGSVFIKQRQSKLAQQNLQQNQRASLKTKKSNIQKQITIEYQPLVKKVIERQRPFEEELQRIPKEKITTRRINNGKDTYKGQLNYVLFSISQYQKPHGYGVLAKQNGNVLIGKFDNGSINGLAYYIFSNGSYYDGYMVDNKANDDQGEFHSKAISYIGGFRNNMFHGEGKEIANDYYFQGIYQNHLKKSGTLMWNNNSSDNPTKLPNSNQAQLQIPAVRSNRSQFQYKFVYQGKFNQNQQFTGQGKLKDPNGEYTGEFFDGKKHGQGAYVFDNMLKYIGEYKNNQKQGYGKLYNCDTTMAYEGFWKNNLPDGKGYSYGLENKPVQLQFIQGISTILAPQQK